jgi:hypothetical protein
LHEPSDVYNRHFFQVTASGSTLAARHVLGRLWSYRQFHRVIDVGCGIGTWLTVAHELGAKTIIGLDGDYVPDDMLLVSPDLIQRCDLSQQISIAGNYDLSLCLEVAEHLPPERARTLVEDLCRLSSVVVFSAAIPYQGGDGHFNEMWPESWAELFAEHDFLPCTQLRRSIWNIREIPWWYRQNLIVYVCRSAWSTIFREDEPADRRQLTAIHPESYLWNARRDKGKFTTSYEFDLAAYYSVADGESHLPTSYGPEFPAPRPENIKSVR